MREPLCRPCVEAYQVKKLQNTFAGFPARGTVELQALFNTTRVASSVSLYETQADDTINLLLGPDGFGDWIGVALRVLLASFVIVLFMASVSLGASSLTDRRAFASWNNTPGYTTPLVIPPCITSVEKRAVRESALSAGAREVLAAQAQQLNHRELQILQRVCEGYKNREISEQLGLELSTIKWYATGIYEKLQVRNRTQAVAKAQALGGHRESDMNQRDQSDDGNDRLPTSPGRSERR